MIAAYHKNPLGFSYSAGPDQGERHHTLHKIFSNRGSMHKMCSQFIVIAFNLRRLALARVLCCLSKTMYVTCLVSSSCCKFICDLFYTWKVSFNIDVWVACSSCCKKILLVCKFVQPSSLRWSSLRSKEIHKEKRRNAQREKGGMHKEKKEECTKRK